ncbi:MAG TPA: serine/threonine-protein kinase [Kofleriaceae bacterium]
MRSSLGPYQLVRRIGRGGMAEVFLARSYGASGFARTVAIKALAPELVGNADLERALIHEATLAGKLHHRNLVAVLGLGVDDGVYFVVMEYVDGGDLARVQLPEPLALHVVCELALGLAHLHAARDERGLPLGIVHRDISPSNVLVSSTGDVKLADFGIAKATALADLTGAGTRKGTYAYMSPEQLAGEAVSPASDQFGLAVTLVELITGRRPFGGDTPWAVMEAIRGGDAQLDGLAGDVGQVVRRALALDPAARFAAVDELRIALDELRVTRERAGTGELADWVKQR